MEATTNTAAPSPGTAEKGMSNGWFTELSPMWPGQGMSLKVNKVLYTGKSDFQDMCVMETEAYGNVLVLDGVIQATEKDEFSYQEMLTHIPACSLERPPRRALVVGGGDGGVLRELARYSSLEEIHMAEIDRMVPEVSKKYLPQMAVGFNDPRVTLHICDGIQFVKDAPEGSYDLIIVDSSDPVGPAEVLFEKPFFEALHRAVAPGGVVCTQAESLWLHLDIIKALAGMCASVFQGGSVSYAYTTIPTYPSGQIGMMVCSKAREGAGAEGGGQPSGEGAEGPLDPRVARQAPAACAPGSGIGELRYYTREVHAAAFVLPKFARDALAGSLTFQ